MRTSYKFLALGALFGFMFPIVATLIELFAPTPRPAGDTIISIHANDPLIMIIDTAPFFLGLFAFWIGQRQEKNENINKELMASLEKLQSAQKKLLDQERIKSQFELSSQIAHELKNPLNFIINFTETSIELVGECNFPGEGDGVLDLEQMAALKDDLQRNLEMIHKHGHRSGSILNEMLTVGLKKQLAQA